MQATTNREDMIQQLQAPYAAIERFDRNGEMTAAWALISGGAEFVADALLQNPSSDYWRNASPLEDGPEGAAIRWLRESSAGDTLAEERFAGYASAPGCGELRKHAGAVRYMLAHGWTALGAIAHTSDSGDEPISEGFPSHIRERLIAALPAHQRAEARQLQNDWHD